MAQRWGAVGLLLLVAALLQATCAFMLPSGSALSVQAAARVQLQRPHFTSRLAMAAEGVSVSDLEGQRLWLNFAAFGFANRTCQLTLTPAGDCIYSDGMVSAEPGSWRIETEEGTDYLQFTCPLTELYSEIFDIPSALLFWRAELVRRAGEVQMQEGVIISEKVTLFGLRTNFIREGSFRGRVLRADEPFPSEGPITRIARPGDERKAKASGMGGAPRRRKAAVPAGEAAGGGGGVSAEKADAGAQPEPSEAQP
eukprot:TRINITY_DN6069_c0_g1_i1.p1 TRINITY_DN6069_c0_g1~~TRINITY_DN6069_c0_g1_i1.p1  ORF type:complete len:254 (-),score=72.15 TRINITY_DN6069_c0_g1_i1:185-946(-)